MDRIGVIVPVYRVEKYIDRCVQSILRQSYRDFVLVLVDDGSPDLSGKMCDEYAAEDPRVHVIHQKNGGLSSARNAGLDYLADRGDCNWITFIDSDDWIHPQMLEWMIQAADEKKVKVCVSGYSETLGDDPWSEALRGEAVLWPPQTFYREHFINATIACAKLYHRDCFKTLRFPEGKLHEDEFITYQVLLAQERVAVISEPLYAYYVNSDSITKSQWKPKRLDAWEAFEEQLAYFQAHNYPELVTFRLRGYLENALVNLEGAKSVSDEKSIRFIEKRIRNLIRRCWHARVIHFRYDFDLLVRFYPLTTRVYRFYLEKIKK